MARQFLKYSWILILVLAACNSEPAKTPVIEDVSIRPAVVVPEFSADSAYQYISKQVSFGPRVPGTKTHYNTYLWLQKQLLKWCDTVYMQNSEAVTFDGKTIPIYNLIGSFNLDNPNRVLLGAHWDTRPFADQDDSASNKPILGANDGASGVGVLLEMARIFNAFKLTNIGIDIVFFDSEDWGNGSDADSYCLGSQYWGKNPHVPNYRANYGILLDMVGAKNSTFAVEGYSSQFAPQIVSKVWNKAAVLGYSNTFITYNRGMVTDDHYYVNKYTGIPMVNIINYDPKSTFGDFWHTHDDDMDIINKQTLKMVGETVLHVLYNE